MLIFYRKSLEKNVEKFIEDIKKASKNLDKENQKFIEDIFLEKKDGTKYTYYGSYLRATLKQVLLSKKDVKLNDIFSKNIYPAMELLTGKKFFKIFLEIAKNATKYSFSRGYSRRMVRSSSYYNYIDFLFDLFTDLVDLNFLNLDILTVVKGEYDNDGIYGLHNPYLIAYEIDNGNKELIDLIKGALGPQKSKIDLNYSIIQAIFISSNKELLELTGKLLLAAKLQEGVRQEICENMDRGLQENFEYMFKIIYDNNLIRFSSVKRALATWTGLTRDELLKSDDNVEVYLGLWNKSTRDIKYSVEAMEKLLKSSKYHIKLLISYYLDIIENKDYQREIAKKVIKEYADTKEIIEILACYLNFVITYGSASDLKENLKNEKIVPETFFKNKKEALEFFDILEKALVLMAGKDEVFNPCIFPWFYQSISTHTAAVAMGLICSFYPDDNLKNRMMKHLKEINTWNRGYYLDVLFEKPSNKEQKDFVISMLSDRTNAGVVAYEIAKNNNLVKEYSKDIEDFLRLKNGDTRKNLINLLMEQDKKGLLASIDNLISAKNENKRLAALDILNQVNSKDKALYDKKEVKNLIEKIAKPTDAEKILIENLSDKKKKESEDTLSKLYDVDYKVNLAYEVKKVEKVSKTVKKNKKDEYIIEISSEPKNFFSKTTDELFEIVKKLSELYIENENYEYMSFHYNEYVLLRDKFSIIKNMDNILYGDEKKLTNYPLEDTWKDFYKKEIKDFPTLLQLYLLLMMGVEGRARRVLTDAQKDIYMKMLGFDVMDLSNKLKKANLKYVFSRIPYDPEDYDPTGHVIKIISLLFEYYSEENKKYLFEFAKIFSLYVLENIDAKYRLEEKKDYRDKTYYNIIFNAVSYTYSNLYYIPIKALKYLEDYYDEKSFTDAFLIKNMVAHL